MKASVLRLLRRVLHFGLKIIIMMKIYTYFHNRYLPLQNKTLKFKMKAEFTIHYAVPSYSVCINIWPMHKSLQIYLIGILPYDSPNIL